MNRKRLQSGQQGERMAEQWFVNNGWHMVRTQPAIQILGTKPGKLYGRIFTVRMIGKGGVPDYTGYVYAREGAQYQACEVKEAVGDSMPCSRLYSDQRAFMKALPYECAWVGVWWVDHQQFEMFPFKERGAYKRGE